MSLSVFVLMPFAKKFNDRYELAIKGAIKNAGMRGNRVDEQSFHRQGITERVVQQIQKADILIADMSTNNLNVIYEVGYAHAKNKLCILLTKNPAAIPFDLKNKRYIVFASDADLKSQLLKDLKILKAEAELSFDVADVECVAKVPVNIFNTQIIGSSQATSIRARVKTSSEAHLTNVPAQMIKIERRIDGQKWRQFKLEQPISLTWTDTDTILTDFPGSVTKYVNVFHVDHKQDQLTIWRMSMPLTLLEFLSAKARYRVTVSVMERLIQLDVVWRGQWNTMVVERTEQAKRTRRALRGK
jgi:hypothetical protein